MSDWAKQQAMKMEAEILKSRLEDLRRNPYDFVANELGLEPNDPEVLEQAKPVVARWNEDNRASAYIFGDTYAGMPIDEVLPIVLEAGFGPIGQMPNGLVRFKHDYLGLALVIRCDNDQKMTAIVVDVALAIRPDLAKTSDFCGLGLCDPEVVGSTLHAQMDATGGFRVKMAGLRRMASAGFNSIPV